MSVVASWYVVSYVVHVFTALLAINRARLENDNFRYRSQLTAKRIRFFRRTFQVFLLWQFGAFFIVPVAIMHPSLWIWVAVIGTVLVVSELVFSFSTLFIHNSFITK